MPTPCGITGACPSDARPERQFSGHFALSEIECWQGSTGKIDEFATDRNRPKVDAGEAELGVRAPTPAFDFTSSPE